MCLEEDTPVRRHKSWRMAVLALSLRAQENTLASGSTANKYGACCGSLFGRLARGTCKLIDVSIRADSASQNISTCSGLAFCHGPRYGIEESVRDARCTLRGVYRLAPGTIVNDNAKWKLISHCFQYRPLQLFGPRSPDAFACRLCLFTEVQLDTHGTFILANRLMPQVDDDKSTRTNKRPIIAVPRVGRCSLWTSSKSSPVANVNSRGTHQVHHARFLAGAYLFQCLHQSSTSDLTEIQSSNLQDQVSFDKWITAPPLNHGSSFLN